MSESIKTIIQWHEQTFPDATLDGQIDKFNTEYDEYFAADTLADQVEELADVFIVAFGMSRFSLEDGLFYIDEAWQLYQESPFVWKDLEQAINKKMQKNRNRTWGFSNGNYQHISEGGE